MSVYFQHSPSLACLSKNRRLEFALSPSMSWTDEARRLLHTLFLDMDWARQVVDRAWDGLGRSQVCLGDEWSRGTDSGEEWGLELMRARVSLVSAGLQASFVGERTSVTAVESSLALGVSTRTVSGSSWGRDCLLVPNSFNDGRRKWKNLPFPKGRTEIQHKVLLADVVCSQKCN